MGKGLKIAVGGVLAVLLLVGGEFLYLKHRDAADQTVAPKVEYKSDPDDETLVGLKHEHPMSLKDEKDLKGRTLWMSAGGQMDYYLYNGKVDYAHSQGTLLGAEKILVKDAVEAVAPKSAGFRIPQGDKQILLVFTKPDDAADANKLYAVPVGNVEGGDSTISTDSIFFYEDPHKSFAYWGPAVWKAIDAHQATLGMTEAEVQMALGQVSNPHGEKMGNRMVEFDDQGHPKKVTFENNKAVKIEDEAHFSS